MKPMEVYNTRNKDCSRSKPVLKHTSSDSSNSSISSVILSMCPISINPENYLSISDNQSTDGIEHPQRTKSFSERSQSKSSHSQVTLSHHDSIKSYTSSLERKCEKDTQSINEDNTVGLTRTKSKRNKSYQSIVDLLNRSPSTDSSEISMLPCLQKLLLHPKLFDETESITCSVAVPSSCTTPPIRSEISPERIQQIKQRQIELDRTIEKLLETIKYETNKNIKQISKYWSYIKQMSLDKYQPKNSPYQFFDYLIKCTYLNREHELYFEENDEIKAALQVLTATLTIIHSEHSFSTINQLFDDEERCTREMLQCKLESLLSSYADGLSFIRERIRCYQSNFTEEMNCAWIQTIQIDYPCLIEKISNDFLNEIPRIDQLLVQMLRNTNKHLLNIHFLINTKK